jgi:hypothetical protein
MPQKEISDLLLDLSEMENEHEELNSLIDSAIKILDELTVVRLKKRKLYLKDKIIEIRSKIYPDIIA